MSVHLAFIDLNEADQAKELRSYLRNKGAEISEEGTDDFVVDLKELIGACSVVWSNTESTEAEVEGAINSLISLIIIVPNCDELVTKFCSAVFSHDGKTQWDQVRLRVLSNLYNGFNERSAQRLPVYMAMVKLAGRADLMSWIPADLKQVKNFCEMWSLSKAQSQDLLRSLHDAFLDCGQKDNASRVMIELLGSYTESTASQARDDAHKCIITSLADPNTFLLDHLLTLKPVKLLEGDKLHELLMIFIIGKLADYLAFCEKNKDYIATLGLNHEQNVRKMRLLTFMHLAEGHSVMDFETIEKEMGVGEDEVEQFVIDAIKTKTVMGKIDQMNRKVLISSSTQRTFGKQNWMELNSQLLMWKNNLDKIKQGFGRILSQSSEQL